MRTETGRNRAARMTWTTGGCEMNPNQPASSQYAELTSGRVWYEERGHGEPLVVLHGGAVDSRFFEQNVTALAERFGVIAIDLWGHGRTPDREGPFSLESFATDVAELIERVAGGPSHLM